ncbi:hypothetical protein [Ligilactobacillus agilis]|uniref:hypothetical protein n=1 Tax=Ligilactobacillus agilis TaxID=1601 RepID=UPI0022E64036|nr:hypothetical protein [Ligilactobacillus agilis]
MNLILRILCFVIMLGIAYLIFSWNRKNSKKKAWYGLAIIFVLGGIGALMDTPEARQQEAAAERSSIKASEKAEESSREAELESEASAASESKQKSSSKKQSDDANTLNELQTAVNFINNQNNAVKASIGQDNKSIVLTVNDSVAEVAKNAANDQANQDNWIKFTGEINKLTQKMLTGKYNVKVPFIIQAQDGTKLMESKHGYTVYDIMDTE